MKFNQFSKKKLEIRNYLLTYTFAGFDGIGLHTSVVNATPVNVPNTKGMTALETKLKLTSINIREVLVTESFTSHIV
ncbi:hypothetical protein ACWGOQ_0015695 [Aquimarina sp. M1]